MQRIRGADQSSAAQDRPGRHRDPPWAGLHAGRAADVNSISRRLGGGLLLVLLLTVTLVGQGAVWVFDRALGVNLSSDMQPEPDGFRAASRVGPQGPYLVTGP